MSLLTYIEYLYSTISSDVRKKKHIFFSYDVYAQVFQNCSSKFIAE